MNRDTNYQMCKLWYYAGMESKFGSWSDQDLKELALEISELSQAFPLYFPLDSYKKNDIKKAFDYLLEEMYFKYISVTPDNHIIVTTPEQQFILSPIQSIVLLEYAVNRLSGDQLTDKPEYWHIKLAKALQ